SHGPVHRRGHFRVWRLRDIGELPIGRHLFLDRADAEALSYEGFHCRRGTDAVQRSEYDLELVEARRPHQALPPRQLDVRPVRSVIEKANLAEAHSLVEGERSRRGHLTCQVYHDLIVGWHRLAAALVVEL